MNTMTGPWARHSIVVGSQHKACLNLSRPESRVRLTAPGPTNVQRWISRRWSQLRVAIFIVAALGIGYGVWLLIDHQRGPGIGALVSGLVIASTYVSFGSTVRYVHKYDAAR